tara:strand:- start:331 stop:819 length:489 start_codon:yes stop_codon:yes gene_type:complete
MNSKRLESDGSCTKRVLVEKIKSLGEPVYLVPVCENAINLVYFVADIFRRSGHYVNTIVNNYEPMGMMILILPFQNMVEDIQITRENTLEDLMNDVNNDSIYKIIRACGTSISLAWMYTKRLCESGEWVYCNNVNLNSIPLKVDEKTIYKTTVAIVLQKVIM